MFSLIFSAVLFLIGLYLAATSLPKVSKNAKNKVVAVKLEVVEFKEQRTVEDHTVYAPVYKVFSGEYQGISKLSLYEEVTDKYTLKVGDLIDGFIVLPDEDLISKESLPMKTWMPILVSIIGFGLMIVAMFLSGLIKL